VPDATFACPDLTTFARLDELGLVVVGQRLEPDRAVLACRVADPDQWCRRCGCEGTARDTVTRRLAHEPLGWRPTILEVTVRRYRCTGCAHVWRQDTNRAAEPRSKLSRRGLRWALEALVVGHLTVARIAEALAISWNTANSAVLAEGKRVLIEDPHRFDGVKVIGVDEHVWRHTRRGDKYVTVIIDLTSIRDGSGPARLLDMVAGRSKQAFSDHRRRHVRDLAQQLPDRRLDRVDDRPLGLSDVLRRAVADQRLLDRVPRDAQPSGDRRDRHPLHPTQPTDLCPVLHTDHPPGSRQVVSQATSTNGSKIPAVVRWQRALRRGQAGSHRRRLGHRLVEAARREGRHGVSVQRPAELASTADPGVGSPRRVATGPFVGTCPRRMGLLGRERRGRGRRTPRTGAGPATQC